eukprot:1917650-Pleurochrysis_carterae.AAC.1
MWSSSRDGAPASPHNHEARCDLAIPLPSGTYLCDLARDLALLAPLHACKVTRPNRQLSQE